jgi:hypothetical protein
MGGQHYPVCRKCGRTMTLQDNGNFVCRCGNVLEEKKQIE